MELEPILFRYRARDLRAEDIAQVQATIASHYARGRSFIARTLCELWEWRQPNGGYKEFAARDLLLRLEESGRIELPPRQRVKSNVSKKTYAQIPLYIHQELNGTVGDYAAPVIEQARGAHSDLWDYLMHHYHYLGRPKLVGEHWWASTLSKWCSSMVKWWRAWGGPVRPGRSLRGTVTSGGLSSSSARVCTSSPHLIANNVRFLILPWVSVVT